MLNLLDSVRGQCTDIPDELLSRHFRSLPATYFDRYSAAEIVRHLRMLSKLSASKAVDMEFRPIASHAFEVLAVGFDHTGTLSCITAALAAYGFALEDVQVSTYLDTGADPGDSSEPRYFVIVLWISGQLRGQSLVQLATEMCERLTIAFTHLAQGNLLEAQTVAADTRVSPSGEFRTLTERLAPAKAEPPAAHAGLILGGDYRLQRKLASGGTSEIYLATQESLNRTVAV